MEQHLNKLVFSQSIRFKNLFGEIGERRINIAQGNKSWWEQLDTRLLFISRTDQMGSEVSPY